MHVLLLCKGLVESILNYIQSPLGVLYLEIFSSLTKMLSVPRALCVKSWLKTSLKIDKIPIFNPLKGSEAVKSKEQKCQAPQNTYEETFSLHACY